MTKKKIRYHWVCIFKKGFLRSTIDESKKDKTERNCGKKETNEGHKK
jgi:hypothetical protein